MLLHRETLPRLEGTGLREDTPGDDGFADVVHGCRERERGECPLRQIEGFADREAEPRDVVRVQTERGICALRLRDEPRQRRLQRPYRRRRLRGIRSPGGVVEVSWHGAGRRTCASPPFGG